MVGQVVSSEDASGYLMKDIRGKDEILDLLTLLLRTESIIYPVHKDYISHIRCIAERSNVAGDIVNDSWRRKLCEWSYEVTDHFKFDREVVSIALNYLDRATTHWVEHSESLITKREYQLLAVTSLYIAIKVHGETDYSEGPRRKLKIDAFYELSRKQFDVALIERTERHILTALNWNMNPPTTLKFISTFLSLCPEWEYSLHHAPYASIISGIFDVARYLSELSVCHSDFFCSCKTSVLAFACIIFAIDKLHNTLPIPYSVRVAFLNNIALATGLVSGNAEVLRVSKMLEAIWPGMSPAEDISHEYQSERASNEGDELSVDGKVSPICVIEEQKRNEESPRKRTRSVDKDDLTSVVDHRHTA